MGRYTNWSEIIKLNPIPTPILNELRNYYANLNQLEKVPRIEPNKPTEAFQKELLNFVDYVLNNQINEDGRERYLFKNVVIACILLGYDEQQRTRIYHKITQNCRGRKITELIGWDIFMQRQQKQGKELRFSHKEIERYISKPIQYNRELK